MGYYQMTLGDWIGMKQKLQAELLGVRKSFVRIGYILRKIEEVKGYENDGYKTITEWAKNEYGLEGSTVSRFMSINKEYSIGGFSEDLLPQYEDFKRSQLEEMLKLPVADREMIQPQTPRADIRELKQFNKEAPAAGEADEFSTIVKLFFEENKEILKEVYACGGDIEAMKEAVNPSGNRSYRKGAFFLMMYEDTIKLKKFGAAPENCSWARFFETMVDIFGDEYTETEEKLEEIIVEEPASSWKDENLTEETAEEEEEQPEEEAEEDKNTVIPAPIVPQKAEKEDEKQIAPAQKFLERQEKNEISKQPSKLEKPSKRRIDYMEELTAWGLAGYLVEEYTTGRLSQEMLRSKREMEQYLLELVTDNGERWEET